MTPEWAEVSPLCAPPPQAMRLESERLSPFARRLPTPGRIHAPLPQDRRDGLASSGLAQSVPVAPYRLLCRLDMVLTSGFPQLPPPPPRRPPPPPPSRDAGRSAKASDRKRSHPRERSVTPRPAHVPPLPLLPVARSGGRGTRASRPRPRTPPLSTQRILRLEDPLVTAETVYPRALTHAALGLSFYMLPCPLPYTFLTVIKLLRHWFKNVLSLLNYTGLFIMQSSSLTAVMAQSRQFNK